MNDIVYATLLSLGFDEEASKLAASQCDSVEDAISLLVEGKELDMINGEESNDFEVELEEMKMVLVVRSDLKMTTGKIAAQCVHAALGACRLAEEKDGFGDMYSYWLESGERTVCLRCESEAQLNDLERQAEVNGIIAYVVMDAGRTQVECGSRTVLAIGPHFDSSVNAITGKLKLL